ncbi:MAG: hypothetical protein ACLP6G_17330 [Terriglobales bacterium]
MANAAELTTQLSTLEERVKNHIKFFWVVVGFGFLWLGALTALIIQTKSRIYDLPLQISDSLISTAKRELSDGRLPQAASAVQSATAMVATAQLRGIRPDPAFFKRQIEEVSGIHPKSRELADQVNQFRFTLATYRSQFNPRPVIPKETQEWKPDIQIQPSVNYHVGPNAQFVLPAGNTIEGPPGQPSRVVFDIHDLGDKDFIVPPSRSMEEAKIMIANVTIFGGSQTLGGIYWEDVTFVNVRIKFVNGSMRLHNVRFVNCTFDLPSNQDGAGIADYAALDSRGDFRIG